MHEPMTEEELKTIISDRQRQRTNAKLVEDGYTIWQDGTISW